MKKLVYLENSQEHRWIRLFKALGALMALGLNQFEGNRWLRAEGFGTMAMAEAW